MCLLSLHECDPVPLVVLVDNTPYDPDLADVLACYPKVHLIYSPKNAGFGAGNNLGIKWVLSQTDCEFIFILNNDAKVEPDTIAKLEATLDVFPKAGIATPRIVFMDTPDRLWYGGGEVSWIRGAAVAPGYLGPSDAPLAMQPREVSFASGCALLVRRNLMENLRGFDERFFMYEEDLELCLRAQELGWQIRYEPSALVLHVVQSSSRGQQGFVGMLSPLNHNLSFYTYHLVRNRLINMHLHARGFNYLLFLAGFSSLLLKKTLHFLCYQRWDGIAAIYKGWRSFQRMSWSTFSKGKL